MKYIIVHISDIHFTAESRVALDQVDKLFSAVISNYNNGDQILFVTSGDIAFSGQKEEYDIANTFYSRIDSELERSKINNTQYIFVPGNHDCDFSIKEDEVIRKLIKESLLAGESKINISMQKILLKPQANFFEFVNNLSFTSDFKPTERLYKKHLIQNSNSKLKISINAINSSWLSEENEIYGSIFMPEEFINGNNVFNETEITISVLHHPFNWHKPDEGLKNFKRIMSFSNIILTGHEHEYSNYIRENIGGDSVLFSEAGPLQNSSHELTSFNLITINDLTRKFKSIKYTWSDNIFRPAGRAEEIPFQRIVQNENQDYVKEDFKKYLENPGINFTHPFKKNIKLDDIYVSPDLIDQDDTKSELFNRIQNANDIIANGLPMRILITGESKSGKTVLCKKIFTKYLSTEIIPIYIKGNEIKNRSINAFRKLTHGIFEKQYDRDIEFFKQAIKADKLIIIDGIDNIKVLPKDRIVFIQELLEEYENIVITGTDFIYFIDYMNRKKEQSNSLSQFRHFKIIEFGPKLRDQLIRRWMGINRTTDYVPIDDDTYHRLDTLTKAIEDLIGKNYVPSTPFFILTYMQIIESGRQADLSISQYGSYYELLINMAVQKITKKQEVIIFLDNFLTEFAFYSFFNNVKLYQPKDFESFYMLFRDDYDLTDRLGSDFILNNLSDVDIFSLRDNNITFSHDYIYYYYLAKYLRNNLHNNEEIKKYIINFIDNIHIEEYSNIVLFLTHLSNDPFIYISLVEKSKSVFSDVLPIRLENDIEEINKLIEVIPELYLEARSVEDVRKEKIEEKDETEIGDKYGADSANGDEKEYDELNIVARINTSFKTIEIVGQLVRKYYAKIKSVEKYELINETFNLGLRTLNVILSLIAKNKELFINEFGKVVQTNKKMKKEEAVKEIKKFLFAICNLLSYSMLRRISTSIGSEDLSVTFDKILRDNLSNSNYLILCAIKLEHFHGFPLSDIEKAKKMLENNPLAYINLKQLVINYLYMFNIDQKLRSQVCSLLGIPVLEQLLIEKKSPVKKK